MQRYLNTFIEKKDRIIAYFSMEIGLSEKMPTYSGGLGVLAGDTIKACADLHVPIIAVTLLSEKGYFCQKLDESGNQIENPCDWNPKDMMALLPEKVSVEIEGRKVFVQVWEYLVKGIKGYEVPVYFLDTNLCENSEQDRGLTSHLYGGDHKYRLLQEIVLGIGGVRILEAIGYTNLQKYHMNEGHSCLLILELLRKIKENTGNYDFEKLKEHCVFTTHTPVPAGHDKFPVEMIKQSLGQFLPDDMMNSFFNEGMLNTTLVALAHSQYINGVAKKHGEVSRDMFPGYPIDSITNGVHSLTWTSMPFQKLFDRHIPGWKGDSFSLRYALKINRKDIWDAHMEAKKTLIDSINQKTGAALEYDVLTIGFARRATMYKRPYLLFSNLQRLKDIAENTGSANMW